jgi:hypothetical protein
LGTVSNGNGPLNTAYLVIENINEQTVKIIGDNIGQFSATADMNNTINSASNQINNTVHDIDNFGIIQTLDDNATKYVKIVAGVTIAIFAVCLLLGVLGLIGVVLLVFFKMYSFRYLVYGACGVLIFFGLLTFILAVLFSIITPGFYFGCGYLEASLSSPGSF